MPRFSTAAPVLRMPDPRTTSMVSHMHCTVLTVGRHWAWVRDQFGQKRRVSLTRMFGKGSQRPEKGEQWILSSMFGEWMFAVCINPVQNGSTVKHDMQCGTLNYVIPNGANSIVEQWLAFPTPFATVPLVTATASGSALAGDYPFGEYWSHNINVAGKTTEGFYWRPYITTGDVASSGAQHNSFDWIAVAPTSSTT